MTCPLVFTPERIFRETEGVHFSDIQVPGQNGLDLVHHKSTATSPPNTSEGDKQFYFHHHQTDNNRVIHGTRLFELLNYSWMIPHWYVYLTPEVGALQIPPKTFHRSVSCKSGSILLNHAVRDDLFDENTDFRVARPFMEKVPAPGYYNITEAEVYLFLLNGGL